MDDLAKMLIWLQIDDEQVAYPVVVEKKGEISAFLIEIMRQILHMFFLILLCMSL